MLEVRLIGEERTGIASGRGRGLVIHWQSRSEKSDQCTCTIASLHDMAVRSMWYCLYVATAVSLLIIYLLVYDNDDDDDDDSS